MKRKTIKKVLLIAVAVGILTCLILLGCSDPNPINADGSDNTRNSPEGNQPPETYIHLNVDPDSMLAITTSRKSVYWWGEDQDGRVAEYQFRWGQLVIEQVDSGTVAPDSVTQVIIDDRWIQISDTNWIDLSWITTREESDTRILPIRTEFAIFVFQVKAIDNDGLVDPTPRTVSFPIINSRPHVSFRLESNPYTIDDTFYTFTTRSFVWDATDPDGNETILSHLYAVNPAPGDTQWVELDGQLSNVTLRGLEQGQTTFYLKSQDLAGYYSNVIHFPDSTVNNDPELWYVKEPRGKFLIVDDFRLDRSNDHLDFYREIFTEFYGPEGDSFSVWELKELPYSPEDVTDNLMFFNNVIWYSYTGIPQVIDAFNSMYSYINSPDKRLLLTTTHIDTGMTNGLIDSLYIIAGRISLSDVDPVRLMPQAGSDLPLMQLSESVGRPVFGFIPKAGTIPIYSLDDCTRDSTALDFYEGNPIVGIQRADKSYTLLSVPLKFTNGNDNVRDFIREMFDE